MDHHRGLVRDPPDYLRSSKRGPAMGRAIPPSSVPSLSTGQGFYTVESLQGATVVPPPQPAPPPPRLLPQEPYPRFRPFDQRHQLRLPDDRAFGMPPALLFNNRHPFRRRPLPHPGFARRGGAPGMMRPPPFMGAPRVHPFYPGRERMGHAPHLWSGRRLNAGFDGNQRERYKKQAQKKVKPEVKSLSGEATTTDPSLGEGRSGWCPVCQINCFNAETLEKHIAGARHKRQQESQMHVAGGTNDGGDKEKLDQNNEVTEGLEDVDAASHEGGEDEASFTRKDETMTECENVEAASHKGVPEDEVAGVKKDVDHIAGKTVQGPGEGEAAGLEEEDDVRFGGKIAEIVSKVAESGEKAVSNGVENEKETADEALDSINEATRKVVESANTESGKKDQSSAPGVVQCVSPVSGKKREAKEEVQATKKQRICDAQNPTTKGVSEVCKLEKMSGSREACSMCGVTFSTKLALETHMKGKKHAAFLKKTTSSPTVKVQCDDVKEQATATDAQSTLEAVKECTGTVDLVHGKTGQSVEVQ